MIKIATLTKDIISLCTILSLIAMGAATIPLIGKRRAHSLLKLINE